MTLAAEAADGAARGFTEAAIYHDHIYGPHTGRPEIAHMLQHTFGVTRTTTFVGNSSIRCSTVELVVIDGMSRFTIRDGLIAEYRESVNGGVAMAQLGVEPERMAKILQRWGGWLKDRAETADYLGKAPGWRLKR